MTCNAVSENLLHEVTSHPNIEGKYIPPVKADATHCQETDGYKHIDFGVDVLRLLRPHLYTDCHGPHQPSQTFYKYLYVSAKGESTLAYLVGLKAMMKILDVRFGFPDVVLAVAGGDPQKSLFAAAREINPDVVCTRDVEHVRR